MKGVSTLYHESTYSAEDAERARLYWHSTSQDAAKVARDASVGKLLLGHFSARYNNESQLLEEAKEIFQIVILLVKVLPLIFNKTALRFTDYSSSFYPDV